MSYVYLVLPVDLCMINGFMYDILFYVLKLSDLCILNFDFICVYRISLKQ